MIDLYRRNYGPPQPLPSVAYTDDGFSRTDLANQSESRDELGYVFWRSYDPETHCVVERDGSWMLESLAGEIVPGTVTEVTMRQAKLALLDAKLLVKANEAIAAIPGDDGERARIEWSSATRIRREHPLIAAMAAALGLTETQVDELFVAAANIP